ncbi:unnamed protein product [Dovyalis caffra]|uniref:Multidrug and toxic compound extrusion protein n=1 Tax=Dovyalis caffra TaxID=77055 RepID=A0AAV1RNE1_9ROSI|nr:unnamed protein product [Dovyalis caffra]
MTLLSDNLRPSIQPTKLMTCVVRDGSDLLPVDSLRPLTFSSITNQEDFSPVDVRRPLIYFDPSMDNSIQEKLLVPEESRNAGLKRRIWTESKKIWGIAFPGILARVSSFGMIVVTQSFLGHIGKLELAAFALLQSFILRFINGILIGMSSATETLCGQAFGAGHYHMLGIYLQRSWIVDSVAGTILLPLVIFAAPIFRILGQEEDIAIAAGNMSLWFIPFVYSLVFSLTTQMYLQAQLKNKVVSWFASFSFVLHILLTWIVVKKLEWGTAGAMFALTISSWSKVIGQVGYILVGWCPDTWTGFNKAAFADVLPIVKLSISSGLMICVRVANELGKGNAKAAKFSIKIILSTSSTIGGLWIGLLSGVIVQTLVLSYIIWRTDWDEQVNRASERLRRWFLNPERDSTDSSSTLA